MKLLIGTGFYATAKDQRARENFFRLWWDNTFTVSENVVIVDNSDCGFHSMCKHWSFGRTVHVLKNLGHTDHGVGNAGPLLGWSMSWIIPALIAYSEGCDFIYKEQDCLAFGDWLPRVAVGQMAFGRNRIMPCEQSLFWIRHDFILSAVRDYMLIGGHDGSIVPESKFVTLMESQPPGTVQFHDLPGGRDRPLPNFNKPFYAQRITNGEMKELKEAGLV